MHDFKTTNNRFFIREKKNRVLNKFWTLSRRWKSLWSLEELYMIQWIRIARSFCAYRFLLNSNEENNENSNAIIQPTNAAKGNDSRR